MDYKINEISYNAINGIVTSKNEQKKLTKIQKKLLDYFIEHPKKILSKQTLMEVVWGRIITENSVEKTISKLRACIEVDPLNPKIIVTHFGHGISFEGKIKPEKNKASNSSNTKIYFALALLTAVLVVFFTLNKQPKETQNLQQSIKENQNLLILPMTFSDITSNQVQQAGMDDLLKSTFTALNSEGSIFFDNANLTHQQAMEKHWRIDNELVVLQTTIEKNDETYTAVLEMTNGLETINRTTIEADSLTGLINDQISFISDYHEGVQTNLDLDKHNHSLDKIYIQALGQVKNDNTQQATALIQQILSQQENHYRARLTLSELLFADKKYNESLAQLNTLKHTPFYQNNSSEIELGIARAKFEQKAFDELIEDLKAYQTTHPNISDLKKSKIKLQLADAYQQLGNIKQATVLYQQSLNNIKEQTGPLIYARSYLGQAKVLVHISNDEKVYSLFTDALKFAKLADHDPTQIDALNQMSRVMFYRNEWQEGIKLKKQAIELIQLSNDKSQMASNLASLNSYLMERGLFSEVKKANAQLGDLAVELNSQSYQLQHMHYDIVVALNVFEFDYAKQQIQDQFELAKQAKNHGMMLNNSFLHLEYFLATEDTDDFMAIWNQRTAMIKDLGFDRFQIYMDLYLARYHHMENNDATAMKLINQVSNQSLKSQDFKFYVEAQNHLAKIHMKNNPQLALDTLLNLEQYKPNPNPYLELKAIALNLLGREVEALNLLNQAKIIFNEAWKAENQALLEHLQKSQP